MLESVRVGHFALSMSYDPTLTRDARIGRSVASAPIMRMRVVGGTETASGQRGDEPGTDRHSQRTEQGRGPEQMPRRRRVASQRQAQERRDQAAARSPWRRP